ncbi:hypothetical protein E5673_08980 [Sphingomonas sp. PAMC26645]|uniref:hypothetical protein n=1 Tax=Sphingomonas sp. PAMC26645 TaxID=2565555 RepID=UPI00109D916C|nr:hypothetical protein [Sphingomonas sp. PAMC26645]QCB42348.1 hypothetical protein E5673_08980 [Sphingomonas sp. PAMC26645]
MPHPHFTGPRNALNDAGWLHLARLVQARTRSGEITIVLDEQLARSLLTNRAAGTPASEAILRSVPFADSVRALPEQQTADFSFAG